MRELGNVGVLAPPSGDKSSCGTDPGFFFYFIVFNEFFFFFSSSMFLNQNNMGTVVYRFLSYMKIGCMFLNY